MSEFKWSDVAEAVRLVLKGQVKRVDSDTFKVYRIPNGTVRIDINLTPKENHADR